MKRHLTLLAMCLLVATASFAAGKTDKKDAKMDKGTTVTGWVTDPACAKSHDVARMSDSACAKKCAADGKYVIVTDGDNKVWAIDNSEVVKGHEGHHVKVTGTPNADAGTIHIAKVSMLAEAKSKDKDKDKPMNK